MKIVKIKNMSVMFSGIRGENDESLGIAWKTKDNKQYQAIEIGMKNHIVNGSRLTWKLALAHELGHMLLLKKMEQVRYNHDNQYKFKQEIMAWRIAKSFIKPKHWKEKVVISILRTFSWSNKVDMKKLKIIEMNKGIQLGIN